MYFLLVPIAKFLCLSFFGKQTKKHKSSFFGDITKGRVVNAQNKPISDSEKETKWIYRKFKQNS